jgi:DNA-binding NarL/FixJ family response regulator
VKTKPRILLVDDHQLLLEGLRLALQNEYDVVGALTSGAAVLPACRELAPDAVLLDLSLPERSGLEIIADLQAELPAIRILVITMHADRVMADASLQSGAHGFVPKDSGIPELKTALQAVLAGERFVSGRIPKHASLRAYPPDSAVGLAQLTPRQRKIVHLIGEGKRTADIAADLGVTVPTITFHRQVIRKALGIDSEWGLLRYAILVRMSEEQSP